MDPVIQIENILEPKDSGHLEMLLLVAQDIPGDRVRALLLIVAGANNISGVALLHQLGAETAGEVGHNRPDGYTATKTLPWYG